MVSKYLPSPCMIAVISSFESYDIFSGMVKVKRLVRHLSRRDERGSLIVSTIVLSYFFAVPDSR
jgi:hypothetical protein